MHGNVLAALSVGGVASDLGRSLREAFFMFWETLWALVLGFTLSGIVQAFASKDQMRAKLGNHRPATVARASGYGMVSSSCSYAASAMAKSLFAKGADFVTAMIFMVASTNLVVELGVVMLVLLGWQFMAAEFIGGPIMIVLLALVGGFVFTAPLVEAARRRLTTAADPAAAERLPDFGHTPWRQKVRSSAAWADASSYAVADATMLRKELLIGYTVAGFLAALVPRNFWNGLFIHGHGFWTVVENACVGPLIAAASWVCSIGNIPLAAALWSGGISFGGVVAFVFADLLAVPLLLIYRKFYGGQLTRRLIGVFYVVMVLAGLLTEGLFRLLRLVPTTRALTLSAARLQWNYTTALNIVALGVGATVWWLARHRARLGGGEGYALDPVCAMQVRIGDAPAETLFGGERYYFCADRCRERFVAQPWRYTSGQAPSEPNLEVPVEDTTTGTAVDPICHMTVDTGTATHRSVGDDHFWFCCSGCATTFDADPGRYLSRFREAE